MSILLIGFTVIPCRDTTCLFIMHQLKWFKWKAYHGTKSFNEQLSWLNLPLSQHFLSSPPLSPLSSTPNLFLCFFLINLARTQVSWGFPEVWLTEMSVYVLPEVKKDMNQRKEDLDVPFIAVHLFILDLGLIPTNLKRGLAITNS